GAGSDVVLLGVSVDVAPGGGSALHPKCHAHAPATPATAAKPRKLATAGDVPCALRLPFFPSDELPATRLFGTGGMEPREDAFCCMSSDRFGSPSSFGDGDGALSTCFSTCRSTSRRLSERLSETCRWFGATGGPAPRALARSMTRPAAPD